MKRLELLTQEKTAQEAAEYQVQQDQLQLQADLLETNRQLNAAKRELVEAKSASTLSVSSIIAIQDRIAGLEAGVKAIKALEKELF